MSRSANPVFVLLQTFVSINTNRNMKAVRIFNFGAPDVLKMVETERPVPAADEILIRVYASAVNPIDLKIRDGAIVSRLHVKIELPLTLGWDAAGIVEEVGEDVKNFKPGDAVYGIPNYPGNGSYAEYVAASAGKFALKPKSIGFNEAAAVPVSAVAAWDGIFKCAQLQTGQRILIHGAAGCVGQFAVQFAKWKGAHVIGTASTANLDFVRQLGADEIIDYKKQTFETLRDIDVVFDAAALGNETNLKSVHVLKDHGVLATVQGFQLSDEVTNALAAKCASGKVVYGENRIQEWLQHIAQLIDEQKVTVSIGKILPLEKVEQAHYESAERNVRGKFVLEVRKDA
jgi:NADPH:quinone reductase-like Zn-dependent oxidoreductase